MHCTPAMTFGFNLQGETMQEHKTCSSAPVWPALQTISQQPTVRSDSYDSRPHTEIRQSARADRSATGSWTRDPFELARSLPASALLIPVCDLQLTTRCRNVFHAHGIRVLGDMRRYTLRSALRWSNFGVKTAAQLATVLRALLEPPETPCAVPQRQVSTDHKTLLESILATLDRLPERERLISRSRLGLDGKRRTFVELAELLVLSAERVRQLQARTFRSLQRDHAWCSSIALRLESIFGSTRIFLPLDRLEAADSWFDSLGHDPEVFRLILLTFAADKFCLISINGRPLIARSTNKGFS